MQGILLHVHMLQMCNVWESEPGLGPGKTGLMPSPTSLSGSKSLIADLPLLILQDRI